MFSFFQSFLREKSLLERTKDLINEFSSLSEDVHILFVSAYFFESLSSQASASSVLFQEEKEEALELLLQSVPSSLTLVFYERESIYLVEKGKFSTHDHSAKSFEIKGKTLSFSYAALPEESALVDLHIHYIAEVFTIGFQKEYEDKISAFAKKNQQVCLALNAVYAYEGAIHHGQSFCIDKEGALITRAPIFEAGLFDFSSAPVAQIEDKHELLFKALIFGIKEHVVTSGLTKAVIGLSGGIDSTLVATLATEALGADNVYGVLLPSPNSSAHSVTDAEVLAKNLGIHVNTLPIKECMSAFEALLLPLSTKYHTDERNHSLMLQNLQSRIRAVLLMGLANALPAFLLGTGNKSEATMGYCTLYGDSCAGLFPIGDIYKEEVYSLSLWYNSMKNKEIIPQNSIDKAPSAELAPGQKDTDSLPPYPELDTFLKAILENGNNPFEVEHTFNVEMRKDVMKKMKNSEFKRQQMAPALKISSVTCGVEWK